MTAMVERPDDWKLLGACVGLSSRQLDPWCPDDGPDAQMLYAAARRVCAECPVRLECAIDALNLLPKVKEHSMRGGLTPTELGRLARELGGKGRPVAQHGTRSRYVRGCKCGACRNAHAVYEHQRRLGKSGNVKNNSDDNTVSSVA